MMSYDACSRSVMLCWFEWKHVDRMRSVHDGMYVQTPTVVCLFVQQVNSGLSPNEGDGVSNCLLSASDQHLLQRRILLLRGKLST